jgi:hypothetical protein
VSDTQAAAAFVVLRSPSDEASLTCYWCSYLKDNWIFVR